MPTPTVPTLEQLFAASLKIAREKADLPSETTRPGRFPVVVKPGTRAYLDALSAETNQPISSLAGLIVDSVVEAERKRLESGAPSQ